jgi:hypothetical protein
MFDLSVLSVGRFLISQFAYTKSLSAIYKCKATFDNLLSVTCLLFAFLGITFNSLHIEQQMA